jgi:WD40 repeat protein
VQTLEGHSSRVTSVAFSHDSTRLASASNDNTVKMWDASSCACVLTLEGHSSWVSSVAFSHDSTRLASASNDNTVKIWDASSGACLHTLEGHSSYASSADLVSILALPHEIVTTKPQQSVRQAVMISSDNMWISDDGQKLLWLPTEYRPASAAVSGRCVGVGTGSGKVWICRLQ